MSDMQIQYNTNTNTRGPARAGLQGPPSEDYRSALPDAAAAKKVTQRSRVQFVQMQIQSKMGNTNSKSYGKYKCKVRWEIQIQSQKGNTNTKSGGK